MDKQNYQSPEVIMLRVQNEAQFLAGSNEQYNLGNDYSGEFEDDEA